LKLKYDIVISYYKINEKKDVRKERISDARKIPFMLVAGSRQEAGGTPNASSGRNVFVCPRRTGKRNDGGLETPSGRRELILANYASEKHNYSFFTRTGFRLREQFRRDPERLRKSDERMFRHECNGEVKIMKSLHKTFDILEFVFLSDGEKATPSDVAQVTGMNLATCTRIMGELVARGYLVKVSRKEGYLPGPMIAAMFTRRNAYRLLVQAAEVPVRNLAERIGMPVNLSVSKNPEERVMICCHCGIPGWKQWNSAVFTSCLSTPTERLLFAVLPEEQLEKQIKGLRFPLESWPEIQNTDTLAKELRKMRKDKTTCFQDGGSVTVLGGLVDVPGYPAAAIGFGIRNPGEKEEILSLLRTSLEEIGARLRETYKAY
jgi:DNA-binding IclR family transcriptional regulator